MTLSPQARALAIVGAALFLAGLAQGAAIPAFANPRMALSAHLDAVQSGLAVMVAAVLWSACSWSDRLESIARWSLVVGMVGLWLGITLAAATGASETLPMAGAGHSATALAEGVTSALVLASSLAAFAGWGLFTVALIRRK